MQWSGPSVTTVASVAWRDISLARASDVLLCTPAEDGPVIIDKNDIALSLIGITSHYYQ